MLLNNVAVNLLVYRRAYSSCRSRRGMSLVTQPVPAFAFWIIFSYLERDTHWSGRDATRPIKLDVPRPNVLLGFLHGVSRVPRRVRSSAKPGSERQSENT